MDKHELATQMEEIFERERWELSNLNPGWNKQYLEEGIIVEYPNSGRLSALFGETGGEPELRQFFIDSLQRLVAESGKLEVLCFYTLVDLGFKREALEGFYARKRSLQAGRTCSRLLMMLDAVFEERWDDFSPEDRTEVLAKIRQIEGEGFLIGAEMSHTHWIRDKMFRGRYG